MTNRTLNSLAESGDATETDAEMEAVIAKPVKRSRKLQAHLESQLAANDEAEEDEEERLHTRRSESGRMLEPEGGDFRPGYHHDGTPKVKRAKRQPAGTIAPAFGKAPRKAREPKPCECGCGAVSLTGRFAPGHDAKLRSELLAKARAGDESARANLVARRWATDLQIDAPIAKARKEAERAEAKAETAKARKEAAKVAKERAKVAAETAKVRVEEREARAADAV